MQAILQ